MTDMGRGLTSLFLSRNNRNDSGLACSYVAREENGVELGADKNDHRDDVKPDQEDDSRRERSVKEAVLGKVPDVIAESDSGGEPEPCGETGSG